MTLNLEKDPGQHRALAGASGVSLTSGGNSTYRISGTDTRHTSPGTRPASAHWPQLRQPDRGF